MFVSPWWDLSLSLSLTPSLILSLCLLLQICTKAEFSSGLFKISTNLREGHRSCKFHNQRGKTERKLSHMLSNTTRHHNLPTQWPFRKKERTNFWHLYPLCVGMKAIISAISPNFFWQFLNPQGAPDWCFQHMVPNSFQCRCSQASASSWQTGLPVYSSEENGCDDN